MSLNNAKRLGWIVIVILSLSLVACLGETDAGFDGRAKRAHGHRQ